MNFLSTFPSGFEILVQKSLPQAIPDVRISHLLDGAVLYKSNMSITKLGHIAFFQNSFQVLQTFRHPGNNPIRAMMQAVGGLTDRTPSLPCDIRKSRSFRVVVSKENRLVSPEKKLLHAVERRLSSITGVEVARGRAEEEFWFLARREGSSFFLLRLTRRRATQKTLHKGQLKPEIAHLLCLMSEPEDTDVVLDPFCGYGSIISERVRCFPYEHIYGLDNDRSRIKLAQKLVFGNTRTRRVSIQLADSADLPELADKSISKVVTDPPWGAYGGAGGNTAGLYSLLFSELRRIVCDGGLVVLLLERDGPFEKNVLHAFPCFHLAAKHDVLVSGRKASAYKLRKVK